LNGLGQIVSIYWQLLFLIPIISLVYSATRFDDWPTILREAWRWGIRMAGFLLAIAVVLLVLAKLS
jgi:hypothetical protein